MTAAQSTAGQPQTDELDPNRWRGLIVCLVGGFMTLLDVSIVNVALPSIRQGLHTSQSDTQWVLSGYALTFGLLLIPAGRLGDARGRRTMFVVGLFLFTLASAACGAAQNNVWLVLARLLQGLAGGLLTPQISALIQQLFRGAERGKAFGLFGATVGLSTAIGPLLGGLLIQLFGTTEGWRWVFYVNLPIGLGAIPLALRLLPRADANQRGHHHDYDPVGVLLLGVGVASLLLPFVQEQQWKGHAKWLLLVLAAVLLGAFLVWERHYGRTHEPLLDVALFRQRSYSFGSTMISLYFAGFTAIFFVLTFYLQGGLHYSALLAGLTTIPFALGGAIAAPVAGRVVHRFGRPLVVVGLVLVAVGLGGSVLAVHLVPGHNVGWATLVPLLIAGLGSGMVISPNQTLTLSEVPVARAGIAGGLLQTGQRIGSAVGIAAVGSVFFARLSATHGRGFASGFQQAVLVSILFVAAALAVAVVDVMVDRHRTGADPSSGSGDDHRDGARPAGRDPEGRGRSRSDGHAAEHASAGGAAPDHPYRATHAAATEAELTD